MSVRRLRPLEKGQKVDSYDDLVTSFGYERRLEVEDGSYQGDTRALLRNPETGEWGVLYFGWGSCSGCDALQACSDEREVEALREELHGQIVWKADAAAMLAYLEKHDWEGDAGGDGEGVRAFREGAGRMLRGGPLCSALLLLHERDPDFFRAALGDEEAARVLELARGELVAVRTDGY